MSYTLTNKTMSQVTEKKNITGSRIKQIRVEKDWSQADVERECSLRGIDMTRSKLAKIESGMIRVTDEMIRDLCIVLRTDANSLFEQ
ncbi:helix-turn-helix domain-containing protein [Vibrio fluvialis]|uniref:helix-turn-helix domain-containing protein n=1 Tax=Vibrio fluvialis TaxID=676 RepID=UPI00215CBD8E|nr:helix-turn-helix transcriptional regulator [Vibrio fluvialis]MCR9299865.1 helix-turn-helix domain-containing protein [Vibrio fluvialis]